MIWRRSYLPKSQSVSTGCAGVWEEPDFAFTSVPCFYSLLGAVQRLCDIKGHAAQYGKSHKHHTLLHTATVDEKIIDWGIMLHASDTLSAFKPQCVCFSQKVQLSLCNILKVGHHHFTCWFLKKTLFWILVHLVKCVSIVTSRNIVIYSYI